MTEIQGPRPESSPLEEFNELEQDTIKEIGNISIGSSATILSQLISQQVKITVPSIAYKTIADINSCFTAPCVLVQVEYTEGITGKNIFVMDTRDAVIIAQLMMMQEPDPEGELTELYLSAVSEAMNQMMALSATSLSDMFGRMINISSPQVEYKKIDQVLKEENIVSEYVGFIQVAFRVEVAELIDSQLVQLMPVDFARKMVDELLSQHNKTDAEETEETAAPAVESAEKAEEQKEIKFLQETEEIIPDDDSLKLLQNIMLEVTGVIGETKLPLGEILQLSKGSMVELDRDEDRGVDVLINGKKVAEAGIVAVGNQYGLRLTKLFNK